MLVAMRPTSTWHKVAIAIGDTPKTATFFAAYSGSELPPEVQKLIDGH